MYALLQVSILGIATVHTYAYAYVGPSLVLHMYANFFYCIATVSDWCGMI